MATSEAMDDSFRVRVEKIFGSLTSSSSSQNPSSLQSTLWSLNDDEVEKREWRGDAGFSDRDNIPCSSSFDDLKRDRTRRRNMRRELEEDLDELDDDGGESNTLRRRGAGSDSVDEWDIRSSIGLDSTFDNEEEEDEYDKVASGRENAGERLYMKTVTDQESYLNIHNVLPKSFRGAKDPRANRLKAKVRLQEDEAEAREQNSNRYYDTEVEGCCGKRSNKNGPPLRSILKRKDSSSDSKPNKRVRFDPSCKVVCEDEDDIKVQAFSPGDSSLPSMKSDDEYEPGQIAYFIPDYLCNPSKYTCYSLNSSGEVEEKSSSDSSTDFLEPGKSLESSESESEFKEVSVDVHKPVVFIRKKKAGEVNAINSSNKVEKLDDDQSSHQNGLPVGIAAGNSQELEAGRMEEEDSETNNTIIKGNGSQKAIRHYRTKLGSDESDQ